MTNGFRWRGVAALGLLGAGLLACSRAPEASAAPASPTPVEDSFGPGFGNAFRADPNSTPINPTSRDVVPVNPNAEPLPVP